MQSRAFSNNYEKNNITQDKILKMNTIKDSKNNIKNVENKSNDNPITNKSQKHKNNESNIIKPKKNLVND